VGRCIEGAPIAGGFAKLPGVVPARVEAARHWLDGQRDLWNTRLDQLDAHLLTLKESPR